MFASGRVSEARGWKTEISASKPNPKRKSRFAVGEEGIVSQENTHMWNANHWTRPRILRRARQLGVGLLVGVAVVCMLIVAKYVIGQKAPLLDALRDAVIVLIELVGIVLITALLCRALRIALRWQLVFATFTNATEINDIDDKQLAGITTLAREELVRQLTRVSAEIDQLSVDPSVADENEYEAHVKPRLRLASLKWLQAQSISGDKPDPLTFRQQIWLGSYADPSRVPITFPTKDIDSSIQDLTGSIAQVVPGQARMIVQILSALVPKRGVMVSCSLQRRDEGGDTLGISVEITDLGGGRLPQLLTIWEPVPPNAQSEENDSRAASQQESHGTTPLGTTTSNVSGQAAGHASEPIERYVARYDALLGPVMRWLAVELATQQLPFQDGENADAAPAAAVRALTQGTLHLASDAVYGEPFAVLAIQAFMGALREYQRKDVAAQRSPRNWYRPYEQIGFAFMRRAIEVRKADVAEARIDKDAASRYKYILRRSLGAYNQALQYLREQKNFDPHIEERIQLGQWTTQLLLDDHRQAVIRALCCHDWNWTLKIPTTTYRVRMLYNIALCYTVAYETAQHDGHIDDRHRLKKQALTCLGRSFVLDDSENQDIWAWIECDDNLNCWRKSGLLNALVNELASLPHKVSLDCVDCVVSRLVDSYETQSRDPLANLMHRVMEM